MGPHLHSQLLSGALGAAGSVSRSLHQHTVLRRSTNCKIACYADPHGGHDPLTNSSFWTRRQLPMVKVARRWRFQDKIERVWGQGTASVVPGASVRDLGRRLQAKGYQARFPPVAAD